MFLNQLSEISDDRCDKKQPTFMWTMRKRCFRFNLKSHLVFLVAFLMKSKSSVPFSCILTISYLHLNCKWRNDWPCVMAKWSFNKILSIFPSISLLKGFTYIVIANTLFSHMLIKLVLNFYLLHNCAHTIAIAFYNLIDAYQNTKRSILRAYYHHPGNNHYQLPVLATDFY